MFLNENNYMKNLLRVSSSLAYGPHSLTNASFRMTAHTELSSVVFLPYLNTRRFQDSLTTGYK